jgi:6-phosphofructokinase 1
VDNDIPFIDRSFGFQTACEEAVQFIDAANIEAEAAEYGVGIVKLMGRYCGYIAVASSLASRDVNICIIPEVHFQLEGQDGLYEAIIERAKIKGHCVVVIAEGAEDGLIEDEKRRVRESLGIHEEIKDESGNIKSVVSITNSNLLGPTGIHQG